MLRRLGRCLREIRDRATTLVEPEPVAGETTTTEHEHPLESIIRANSLLCILADVYGQKDLLML